ncbi:MULTISPECIES: PhzF family phenazine biosynthesis protein [unclassified Microbulbifer]|uniref:PhzF family phenazine biosynthesis protein n=1 Tax=unclassified Microbulbifer TaxID=2619833 RepID=UPI0027E43F13|nr:MULTISPECIES: PhzF family phenazine biosynthesis protein [unclassified Microbulbifer]
MPSLRNCSAAIPPRCRIRASSVPPGETASTATLSAASFPAIGIDEDPVTGSAHTLLTPYWAAKLDRMRFTARQISPRGGELECELVGDRVLMRGRALTYLRGQITL